MSEARSLWSPEPRPQEVTAPGSRIERADYHREIDDHRGLPHYEAGPYRRDPAAGGANHAAPGVENRDTAAFRRSQYQSPEEAQREATRIGMDAGPGAPFALIGSEGRSAPPSQPSTPWRQSPGTMTQGAPYGRPVNEMRPTQPGYETPREFVQRESEYGPAERVPAYRPQGDGVSQAGYSRPPVDQATWDGGPGPVPADVHSHDADPGVRHAVGTMEPHQRDRQYHDSELNALMQGLDRERMANQPSRREALPSNQYYTTSDPSLRPYEQMQQRIRPEAGSASARPGMDGAGLAPVWDGSPYGAAPPNNTSPAGPSPWGPRPGSQ